MLLLAFYNAAGHCHRLFHQMLHDFPFLLLLLFCFVFKHLSWLIIAFLLFLRLDQRSFPEQKKIKSGRKRVKRNVKHRLCTCFAAFEASMLAICSQTL